LRRAAGGGEPYPAQCRHAAGAVDGDRPRERGAPGVRERDRRDQRALAVVVHGLHQDAHTAGVGDAVAVGVPLLGIRDQRTVVACVADAVVVRVCLVGVRHGRAVVPGVADAVVVVVAVVRAAVARVADAIVIGVGLGGIRDRRAVVARV